MPQTQFIARARGGGHRTWRPADPWRTVPGLPCITDGPATPALPLEGLLAIWTVRKHRGVKRTREVSIALSDGFSAQCALQCFLEAVQIELRVNLVGQVDSIKFYTNFTVALFRLRFRLSNDRC